MVAFLKQPYLSEGVFQTNLQLPFARFSNQSRKRSIDIIVSLILI
jgi:hypothetical protein